MSTLNESSLIDTDTVLIWLAKAAGAIVGSAISLAYVLPAGKREAAIRFAVGIICGLIFGGAISVKIAEQFAIGESLGKMELMVIGSTAASFVAWSALGIFTRFVERIKAEQLPKFLPQNKPQDKEGS